MNRVLLIAVIIVSLGTVGIIGYSYGSHKAPSSIPTANPDTQSLAPSAPKVFEKQIEVVSPAGGWFILEGGKVEGFNLREAQTLKFAAIVGNRVEGEVTLSRDSSFVFGQVGDPYGNVLFKTQKYPWRFAFVAATTGEYSLEVNSGSNQIMGEPVAAHLKVTIHGQ